MKKVLCALGLMFTAVSSGLATTYPLTIENCGYQETFTRPPERVVALGQNTVEILLLLGLQKQVVASAFWPTTVLPQLAEQNAKIKTLTVEIPSLESVLDRLPTAKVLQVTEKGWLIEAEVFGTGIQMWIRSQGDYVKVL